MLVYVQTFVTSRLKPLCKFRMSNKRKRNAKNVEYFVQNVDDGKIERKDKKPI